MKSKLRNKHLVNKGKNKTKKDVKKVPKILENILKKSQIKQMLKMTKNNHKRTKLILLKMTTEKQNYSSKQAKELKRTAIQIEKDYTKKSQRREECQYHI